MFYFLNILKSNRIIEKIIHMCMGHWIVFDTKIPLYGALCFTAHATLDILDERIEGMLILCGDTVNWPSRSFDLTPHSGIFLKSFYCAPLIFFLKGYWAECRCEKATSHSGRHRQQNPCHWSNSASTMR